MSYLLTILALIVFIFDVAFPMTSFADGQPVINEFLPHPGSGKEWVEFYVPDGSSINNYWIDDDTDFVNEAGGSTKKQIITTIQGSDSQHMVFELPSSMFNNDGDTIALFSSDGMLVDQYSYSKDPGVDVSIGRTPDGTGNFQVLMNVTKGSPNSPPQPTITPTPLPTDKPTKEPKPTETPKPAKSPAVTITVSVSKNSGSQSILADSVVNSNVKNSALSTKVASNDAKPTSILRKKSKVAPIKTIQQKRILVKGVSSSMPQIASVIIAGILFLSCGILLYLKKKEIWIWKRD